MKKLLLLILLASTVSLGNNPTPSTISEVTVYLDGAQITRSANIKLSPGSTEFTFDKLSPYIQESSIQISGLKNASILSINYGINYLSKQNQTEEIESFQAKIKSLYDKIQFEDDLIAGYNEELNVIQANRHLGNDNQVVNLEKLKQFSEYYRIRITEIKNNIHSSEKKKQNFQTDISDLQKQLAELNVNDKIQTGQIKIKLNTSIPENLNLVIKYNVRNAGWFPIYDLRAEKINEPLELAYKAHVFQNTGIIWENVKLTLSTSDPNTNNIKPEMNPKYLNFINFNSLYQNQRAVKAYNHKYNPMVKKVSGIVTDQTGSPLPGVTVIEKGTTNGTQTDFDGRYNLTIGHSSELMYSYLGFITETLPIHSTVMNVSLDEDATQLSEVVVTGYGTTSSSRSVEKQLRGQVAGLEISSANGAPGAFIKLRGISALKNGESPLYIVDGVPVDENQISAINPNDIENFEVLNDVDASSIYGYRANSGAILITTKKGEYTSNGDIIEQGITNTRFEIKKPYVIVSDGDITVIEIDNYSVPATYSYFAAPVLNENVFLTAKIGNWEQYNLLPAEANVYFEGSYSGKTNINPLATTDSLTVSLGVDPNVVVKRTELKDFKKSQYLGSNKVINKAYKLEVKNNKNSSIDIAIFDRIPVSQNRDIKVEDIETGMSSYDLEKGILQWKFKLSQKDKKIFNLSYAIKFPKSKRVNL